ncbi:O-antigen ligase family protein [Sphingomonas sp. ac-8]|uniref:O-antigen ligase family protein n=1 Tax=Sphingomonas sp. ac-8 TaxID=3242977 RepID=UPI003A80C411
MSTRHRSVRRARPSLSFGLLSTLLVVLCLAGGASRPDVLGQSVVRAISALAIIATIVFAQRTQEDTPRALFYLLAGIVALPLLQLVPLPPELWQALPGRGVFSAAVTGAQPWRPMAIEPAAALNAAGSLIVPSAIVIVAAGVARSEWERILAVILIIAGVSALVALLQVSGNPVGNPLVNFTSGAVSGLFANRNHFALFLALGCLVAPVWAVQNGDQASWRMPFAAGVMLFFFLVILASGSRAGILTGFLGSVIGVALIRREIRHALRWMPRWGVMGVGVGVVAFIAVLVWLSIASDRAASVNRVIAMTSSEDMRTRAFPVVMQMIGTYLPIGSGMGSFDALFRLHEPFSLLKPTYFNHAHNDFVEVVLDGGIPAIALLLAALGWWVAASLRVWRARPSSVSNPGRLGSSSLLLILIASLFDYPARTPMIMAMTALAAVWLGKSAYAVALKSRSEAA